MKPVSYTHRLHAFKPTKFWSVTDKGVRWEDQDEEAKSGFIPWDAIKSVRLRFEPSRSESRRVGLHIYAPYDHHITNINYEGVLDFKLQKDGFKDFVLGFHGAIPKGANITFHQGSTMGAYIGNIAIMIFVLLLLLFLAPIISITGIPGATSIFRILLIVFFLPLFFKMLKKNKPGTYQPDSVPMDLLD